MYRSNPQRQETVAWKTLHSSEKADTLLIEAGNTNVKLYFKAKKLLVSKNQTDQHVSNVFYEKLEKSISSLLSQDIESVAWTAVNKEVHDSIHAILSGLPSHNICLQDHHGGLKTLLGAQHIHGIGTDRLLNALGSREFVRQTMSMVPTNTPIVSVDAGTATTIQLLNSVGELVGGYIAPGLQSQLNALHREAPALEHFNVSDFDTEELQTIPVEENTLRAPTTTKSAILAGVLTPLVSQIRTIVADIQQINLNVSVVISGGNGRPVYKALQQQYMNENIYMFFVPDINAFGIQCFVEHLSTQS